MISVSNNQKGTEALMPESQTRCNLFFVPIEKTRKRETKSVELGAKRLEGIKKPLQTAVEPFCITFKQSSVKLCVE